MKTHTQLVGPLGRTLSTRELISEIYKNEGLTGFYKGLTGVLLLEAIYNTVRMGLFTSLLYTYEDYYGVPAFPMKLTLGVVSGGIGALMANPADVALIRMTADGWLPLKERRDYRNSFDAILRIGREEGPRVLFKGALPPVARAMLVNGFTLGSYAQARELLYRRKREELKFYFTASMISGFFNTATSLPLDNIKTRVQNTQPPLPVFKVFKNMLHQEGVLALWTGFLPAYLKLAPYNVVTFLLLEELNKLHSMFVGD